MVERLPANAGVLYVLRLRTSFHSVALCPRGVGRRCWSSRTLVTPWSSRTITTPSFVLGSGSLDALQTLDRTESVFYVGTFSKSLFPALRLGFAVAPPWARQALGAAKRCADSHSSPLVQEALAAFITEGHLARHVRRMRRIYGARREALLERVAVAIRPVARAGSRRGWAASGGAGEGVLLICRRSWRAPRSGRWGFIRWIAFGWGRGVTSGVGVWVWGAG